MKIGAQLYTLRDHAKDLDSFSETLKKVADIGYEYVQISGTCAYDGEWLNKELKKNGLKTSLTHYSPDKIVSDTDWVVEEHKKFDCKYIGIGWYALLDNGSEKFIETFAPAAKRIAESGLSLSYHNHDFEFAKGSSGKIFFDEIAEAFDPEVLKFTLDTFWVQAGGADPIEWIKKLRGRTPCVHLKDMSYGRKMAVVGEGNMNFDGILSACVDCGVDYAYVEQDDCNGEDPFACLARSYEFLKSRGFK